MKLGILFVKGDGLISKCIQLVTWGKWSHVAMEISDDLIFETDVFKRVQLIRKEYTDHYEKYTERIEIEITKDQEKELYELINETLGKTYDWKLIFKILFKCLFRKKINYTTEEQFICSELVGFILYNLDIINNYKVLSFSPNGLYRFLKKEGV